MATARFYRLVVSATLASCDQEHLHVIIDANAKIPDRTWAVKSGKLEVLLRALRESTWRLVDAGAEVLVMPCNTAHVVYDELAESCPLEILNIVSETRKEFAVFQYRHPGLLATEGTLHAGLYQRAFADVDILVPKSALRSRVHFGVECIKSGDVAKGRASILEVVATLISKGADSIVIGCTDIPVALEGQDLGIPVFDSAQILARAAVRHCAAGLREDLGSYTPPPRKP